MVDMILLLVMAPTTLGFLISGTCPDNSLDHFFKSVGADFSHGFGTSGSHKAVDMYSQGSCHVLRVHYDQDSYSGSHDKRRGAQFTMHPSGFPSSGAIDAHLSYYVNFPTSFVWEKHGTYTHIGGKLPGLYGHLATCSGGRPADDCFSTRFMWREHGYGELYLYFPQKAQKPDFNTWKSQQQGVDIVTNGNYGLSIRSSHLKFRHNHWTKLEQQIHLNRVGHSDGWITVKMDGSTMFTLHNVVFRTHDDVKVSGVYFSTFFGGSDSHWASQKSTYTLFKDFKLLV